MFPNNPVRLYLYGVLVPVVAVLVFYGIVESAAAALWIAVGASVLGVSGTEVARSKVTPVGRAGRDAEDATPH